MIIPESPTIEFDPMIQEEAYKEVDATMASLVRHNVSRGEDIYIYDREYYPYYMRAALMKLVEDGQPLSSTGLIHDLGNTDPNTTLYFGHKTYFLDTTGSKSLRLDLDYGHQDYDDRGSELYDPKSVQISLQRRSD